MTIAIELMMIQTNLKIMVDGCCKNHSTISIEDIVYVFFPVSFFYYYSKVGNNMCQTTKSKSCMDIKIPRYSSKATYKHKRLKVD